MKKDGKINSIKTIKEDENYYEKDENMSKWHKKKLTGALTLQK